MTTKQLLDSADWVLLALGALLVIRLLVAFAQNRRHTLSLPQTPRTHRMPPEAIFLPVLAYLTAGLMLHPAVAAAMGLPAKAAATPDPGKIALVDVLANNLAMAFAAAACLWVGWRFVGTRANKFIRGPGHIGRQVTEAGAGVLIAFALCQAILMVTIYGIRLWRPEFEPPEHNVINALRRPDRPIWLPLMLWISVAVVTPVAEECFFRGLLQTALGQLLRQRGLAVVLTGLLFGLAHSQQPQVIPALTVFGIILGLLYERNGGLLTPILAHGLFNAKTLLWEMLAQG